MNLVGNLIWGFLWLIVGVCIFGILWDCVFLNLQSKIVPKIVDIGLKTILVIFAIGFLVIMIGGFINGGICK